MNIPIDVSILEKISQTLDGIARDRAPTVSSARSSVSTLLSEWSGAAATSFEEAWESVESYESAVDGQLTHCGGVIGTLASQLSSAQNIVNQANTKAASHHWALDNGGGVSITGLSVLNPVEEWDRHEIERLGSEALDAINGALKTATSELDDCRQAMFLSEPILTNRLVHSLAVKPGTLIGVAASGPGQLQGQSQSDLASVRSLSSSWNECLADPLAERCVAAISSVLNIMTSEFSFLEGKYQALSTELTSAGESYISTDRLSDVPQVMALISSGAIAVSSGAIPFVGTGAGAVSDGAIGWAVSQLLNPDPDYASGNYLCLSFVQEAVEKGGGTLPLPPAADFPDQSAQEEFNWLKGQNLIQGRPPNMTPPPKGALVFYSWDGNSNGHVGISLGNGDVVCTSAKDPGVVMLPFASSTPPHYLSGSGSPEYEGWYMPTQ